MALNVVSNATSYDWATWLLGIWRALIQGGSGAVVAGTVSMGLDPEHFNLRGGLSKTLEEMLAMFIVMGLVQMFVFLQTHGAPDKLPAQ